MLSSERMTCSTTVIAHNSQSPPVPIPVGYVGEFVIPRSGRKIWWTGRVAVGLIYQPCRHHGLEAQSNRWIQEVLLAEDPRHVPRTAPARTRNSGHRAWQVLAWIKREVARLASSPVQSWELLRRLVMKAAN